MPNLRQYYGDHGNYFVPNICGDESLIIPSMGYFDKTQIRNFDTVKGCYLTALHAHQPLILADDNDLKGSPIISNLEWMRSHPDVGDCFMTPQMIEDYARFTRDIVPMLVAEGHHPRIMLEYTGTLLHGLVDMRLTTVIDAIRMAITDPRYIDCVEFLGAPWGHAHAPSTPAQDFKLHVRAWRHHFAALFGPEALARVRMFSPSEMALPNHPDDAFEFVNTLRHCGYESVILQADTVETPDGQKVDTPFLPYRLVVENSIGQQTDIYAILKAGSSNGPMVAEMHHVDHAKGFNLLPITDREILIPPIAAQVMDMENGPEIQGAEFPETFIRCTRESTGTGIIPVNATEYLHSLSLMGIRKSELPIIQPLQQHLIWDEFRRGAGSKELKKVVDKLLSKNPKFSIEGSSWTPERTWVGQTEYKTVMQWLEEASELFDKRVRWACVPTYDPRYREVLFHLLAGQTSCYRYWGTAGVWTERGIELCQRTIALINKYF